MGSARLTRAVLERLTQRVHLTYGEPGLEALMTAKRRESGCRDPAGGVTWSKSPLARQSGEINWAIGVGTDRIDDEETGFISRVSFLPALLGGVRFR